MGFITMPSIIHFTIILTNNINDNNEYMHYYYNDMEDGKIIEKIDTFKEILKMHKIYPILFRHLQE